MTGVRVVDGAVGLEGTLVLAGVDLALPDGALAAVVGPSGVGKTTLLRTIAGLVPLAAGRLLFDDVDVTTLSPGRRDVGMVFQSPALLPRRNVARNVGFPLEIRQRTADEIRTRVTAETRALHIVHLLERRPDQLSRGEEQLVQIARSLVRVPKLLLLDEPFSSLDPPLRRRMRREIRLLQEGYGVTTLFATNDEDDVAHLATHVLELAPIPRSTAATVVRAEPVSRRPSDAV